MARPTTPSLWKRRKLSSKAEERLSPALPAGRPSRLWLAGLLAFSILFTAVSLFAKFEFDSLRDGLRQTAESQVNRYFRSQSVSVVGLRGLRVQGFDASLQNARGSAEIHAPEALVLVDLLDLLYGKVTVDRIRLDGAVLRLTAAPRYADAAPVPGPSPAALAPGAFRVSGRGCAIELSGFLPEKTLSFENVDFEAFRLADSSDFNVSLAATLRADEPLSFTGSGRYAAPDNFDFKADSPRVSTDTLNALLPKPQEYVLAGTAVPAVRAEARPGRPIDVRLDSAVDGLVVKAQPQGLDPISGRIQGGLRYDRAIRKLEVVDLHVDTPTLNARLDGSLDLAGETPTLDISGEATRLPVNLLLERAQTDRVKALGKVDLALAEPYRVDVRATGSARQPVVTARFNGTGGHVGFTPAKERWPEGALDVGLVDVTWDSTTRKPKGTLNVIGGTVRHAESRISAEEVSGTVHLDGDVIRAHPLQAVVTGNLCSARLEYDIAQETGELDLAGALSEIEKTKFGAAIENTRLAGTAGLRAKATKKGQKYSVVADVDTTQTDVAYRWYFDKGPGVGGVATFNIDFTPRKSVKIGADVVLASSPIQATMDFAFDGKKYRLQRLQADSDHVDVAGVGRCLRIPYKVTGGTGTDGHYLWKRLSVADRTWEASASCRFDEFFAEAIGKENDLMHLNDADMRVALDKSASPKASMTLHAKEARIPSLRTDWYVPIQPDPALYPEYKPEFRNWEYNLAADHLETPPWKGSNFTGDGYSSPNRSGLTKYSAEVDGGRIGGTYERNRPDNSYETTIEWTNVPARYFQEHLKLSDILAGPSSGVITYSLDRDDPSTLDGSGHFEVNGGKFSEDFLYSKLQGQAAGGMTLPSLRFKSLKTDIAFKRDTIRTPNAVLESEGVRLEGGGQFVIGGDMDYDIKVSISPEIAKQIPLLQEYFNVEGHRLAQKNIELAFKVSGPTGGPRGQLAQTPPARVTLVSGALEMTSEAIKVIDLPRKIIMDLLKVGGGLVGATK